MTDFGEYMKIESLKYAIIAAGCGSINKAALQLGLSQPHLSSSIHALEEELGFSLFYRTNKGIHLTRKGESFLPIASRMLSDYQRMSAINAGEEIHHFHLCATYHTAVEEAFSLLCSEYHDRQNLSFSLTNMDSFRVIDNVFTNSCSLGILMIPASNPKPFLESCSRKGLQLRHIGYFCYYIHLRQEHPLLKEPEFDMSRLYEYPFIDYDDRILTSSTDLITKGIINPGRCILVDDRDTRYHIISLCDAFTIGCYPHQRIRKRYNWVCIPLPELSFEMAIVSHKNQKLPGEALRYMELLRQEIKGLEME